MKVIFLIMVGIVVGQGVWADAATTMALRHAGSHLLTDGVLGVEVMDPTHPERYNRGVRFSPVAAVLRVWRDGHEFLYSPTDHNPLTEHGGLPTEFDLVTAPPGFREAAEGEPFVKLGVGALRKRGDQYRFFEAYDLIEPARTVVEWGADRAFFRQVLEPVNGYAYRIEATVTVADPVVRIDWMLLNTGAKRLVTECYTHNYFRFNEAPVGPAYVLEFPYPLDPADARPGTVIEGHTLRLSAVPPQAVNLRIPYPEDYEGPNCCVLRHAPDGQAVEMLTTWPGRYTAVFVTADTICPEQFIALKLEPGESVEWTREYRFVSLNPDPPME